MLVRPPIESCGGAIAKDLAQELPGVGAGGHGDFLGSSLRHRLSATVAAFGTQIDDVVGGLDHFEIVLDHDYRVARVGEAAEHSEQFLDVIEMQSGRRLIQNVERAPGGAARKFLRQLDALRLTARERRRRLPEMDVIEADVAQGFELLADRRHRTEELDRIEHRHVEDVGDVLALVLDLERVSIIALAAAYLAGDVNVGQEVHLDAADAVALRRLAAAALHVERKTPRPVAAHSPFRQLREKLADVREEPRVRRGIRTRCAPDRTLVDVNHLVEMLDAFESLVGARALAAAVEFLCERAMERIEYER